MRVTYPFGMSERIQDLGEGEFASGVHLRKETKSGVLNWTWADVMEQIWLAETETKYWVYVVRQCSVAKAGELKKKRKRETKRQPQTASSLSTILYDREVYHVPKW